MADAPGKGVFDRVRLFVDLFLHVVAVNTFIARVILQIGFDILTFYFRASFIEDVYRTASDFRNIALFKEDKATSHWQQRQLVRSDKVFAHTQANHQRTTRTCRQQGIRMTGVHDHCTVRTTQLRDSTQNCLTQSTALFQLPVHQMCNHFGVGFRNEGIATRF